MNWGYSKSKEQAYPKTPKKNKLNKIRASTKPTGRTLKSLIPPMMKKGNSYNNEVPRFDKKQVVKGTKDKLALEFSGRPNEPYVRVNNSPYSVVITITSHHGAKQFGVELNYCKKKTVHYDDEDGKGSYETRECYGGYDLYSTRLQPLFDYIKKRYNVEFVNDPKLLKDFERTQLIEWDEPDPPEDPMWKMMERVSDEIEARDKNIPSFTSRYKLSPDVKKQTIKLLEYLNGDASQWVMNTNWGDENPNRVRAEFKKMRDSLVDHIDYTIEDEMDEEKHMFKSPEEKDKVDKLAKNYLYEIMTKVMKDLNVR